MIVDFVVKIFIVTQCVSPHFVMTQYTLVCLLCVYCCYFHLKKIFGTHFGDLFVMTRISLFYFTLLSSSTVYTYTYCPLRSLDLFSPSICAPLGWGWGCKGAYYLTDALIKFCQTNLLSAFSSRLAFHLSLYYTLNQLASTIMSQEKNNLLFLCLFEK